MEADDTPTAQSDEPTILTTRQEAFAELADLNRSDEDPPGSRTDGASGPADRVGGTGLDGVDEDLLAPPVVAVVVVHNADEWLDETLTSLGHQTYENLSILVIDADSDVDPTPRVARVLPGAYVRRLEHNIGFGPTLNEILELVSGAAFFCLCHDDVALDDDCIHRLVEEAFRSNAGIVGPKIVDWDDPELLAQVGFTIDPSGGRAPYAEHGELDQGQHDAVRDVFAVPGGCMLVRSDLFAHLGGFDPEIDLLGEDLDLCWRTHLVGGRVVVAPAARVRHREALVTRVDTDRLIRAQAAHRIKTTLTNYRARRLVFLLPQLVLTTIVEAIIEASMGRRAHARALLAAWTTNIGNTPALVRSRRRVRRLREHNDRTIRRLQTHTWARLASLIQAHRRERSIASVAVGVSHHDDRPRDRSLVPLGVIAVVAVVVIGSRELFFGALPPIGSFARVPQHLGDVWSTIFGSWNPIGLGSHSSPAAGLTPMAIVTTIFGGAFGFVRRVSILAPIPIGMVGIWRLAGATRSRRAQLVALVVYTAIPLPWNALSQGSWAGLVIYAVGPWLVRIAIRAMREEPFDPSATSSRPQRSWKAQLLGAGLLFAVVGSLVPAVTAVVIMIACGLGVGSVLTGRFRGIGRMSAVSVGGLVLGAALVMPWTLSGPAVSLAGFAGMGSSTHGWLGTSQIMRFVTGPLGDGPLGYGVIVAGALGLVLGRSWRFVWAVRAWSITLVSWGVVWVAQQRWFDFTMPATDILLVPAAVGLALAAACAMAAIEVDLPAYRFGWAHLGAVIAGLGLFIATLPSVGTAAADGRWKMAPIGLDQALGFIGSQRAADPFRVLWVGDPDVVPAAGWNTSDRMTVAVSNDAMPNMTELWAPGKPDGSQALIDAIDLAMDGQTTRVGRVLADMGVRYIVLPRQSVPLPYHTRAHALPPGLLGSLDDQLDLERVAVNDAVVVYQNNAWKPGCTLWPAGTPLGRSVADSLDATGGVSTSTDGPDLCEGPTRIEGSGVLATHQAADPGWQLVANGRKAKAVTLWGWEQGFVIPKTPGSRAATEVAARISYRNDPSRKVVLAVVALGWLVVLAGWLALRRGRIDADVLDEPVANARSGDGSFVQVGTAKDPTGEFAVKAIDVAEHAGPQSTQTRSDRVSTIDDVDDSDTARATGDVDGPPDSDQPPDSDEPDGDGDAAPRSQA